MDSVWISCQEKWFKFPEIIIVFTRRVFIACWIELKMQNARYCLDFIGNLIGIKACAYQTSFFAIEILFFTQNQSPLCTGLLAGAHFIFHSQVKTTRMYEIGSLNQAIHISIRSDKQENSESETATWIEQKSRSRYQSWKCVQQLAHFTDLVEWFGKSEVETVSFQINGDVTYRNSRQESHSVYQPANIEK